MQCVRTIDAMRISIAYFSYVCEYLKLKPIFFAVAAAAVGYMIGDTVADSGIYIYII